MNAESVPSKPRRRWLRWFFILTGLCLVPWLVLAAVVASYLTLDHDAAVLRREFMVATGEGWNTKVQMSLGKSTIDAVRAGLTFVREHGQVADARLALAAIRRASVGVYERRDGTAGGDRVQLFAHTDEAMARRGWARLVGVNDGKDLVLVYGPQNMNLDQEIPVCLAVLSGREMVVVSTVLDAAALSELVQHHLPDEFKSRLRVAGL